MDENWEDTGSGRGDEPAGVMTVVHRGSDTQSEVDAIFARLRAWRDRPRTS